MATALHRRHAHSQVRAASHVATPLEEQPFWKIVLVLYGGIFVLAVVLTTACFVAAHAAA